MSDIAEEVKRAGRASESISTHVACFNAAARIADLEATVKRLLDNEAHAIEEVMNWQVRDNRQPSSLAFTAGLKRQIAYLIEIERTMK